MESHSFRNIILSCEHAGNEIPEPFSHLFKKADRVLNSHRGWDPGALDIAELFSKSLQIPVFTYTYSRLLIEPNRSIGHLHSFSEFSNSLSRDEKEILIQNFYIPHRNRIEDKVANLIHEGRTVIHVGIHTFTPELNGVQRNFDVGLLYDPKHPREKEFCRQWKQNLSLISSDVKIKMNQPYKGSSDGLTTYLRKKFDTTQYLGIELEVNQQLYFEKTDYLETLSDWLIQSFKQTVEQQKD